MADPQPETREPVPYDRFQVVVTEKQALAATVDTLKGEVQKLTEKAATVDTLSTEVNRWKAEAEKAGTRFATFTELSSALGTTNTRVIDIFDADYQALPEANRPDRKAWVETLKAKPAEAAEHLRPWLAPPPGEGGGGGPPKPAPRPVGSGPTPPNAPAARNPAEERRLREQCQKTGNWEPWKAYTKSVGYRS